MVINIQNWSKMGLVKFKRQKSKKTEIIKSHSNEKKCFSQTNEAVLLT